MRYPLNNQDHGKPHSTPTSGRPASSEAALAPAFDKILIGREANDTYIVPQPGDAIMMNKLCYGIAILIFSGALIACSSSSSSSSPKGQMMSAIKKDKTAVITDVITLTVPKNGTGDLIDFMQRTNADRYIQANYLLLTRGPPPHGTFLQKLEADGYVTKKRYAVTANFMDVHSFIEEASTAPNGVFVYFLTKNGKKYFSRGAGDYTSMNRYPVHVKFYKEIPDHVVDYSVPSGNSGQSLVTANVDFRVVKVLPGDIFKVIEKIAKASGAKVPKIGSYIKHACAFTKMNDGYEFHGCE